MAEEDSVNLSFGLGVDQRSQETSLASNESQTSARRIVNYDVSTRGPLVRRTGTTKVVTADDVHSLWAPKDSNTGYYVAGSTLYSFDGTTSTALVSGLTPGFQVSYAKVADDIYWSNGVQSGVITNATNIAWGATTTTGELGQTYAAQVRGTIIRHYRGRIYAVDGRVIWATEPMDYMRVDLMRGFMMMESEVTLFEPVSNGIFVGTANEGVRFLAGNDYKNATLEKADNLPAVRGSGLAVEGAQFESIGQGAIWLTTSGWVYGSGEGATKRLAESMLALPDYQSATTMIRKVDGMQQIVSFAKGGSESAMASDSVTSEVIRNGVLLV